MKRFLSVLLLLSIIITATVIEGTVVLADDTIAAETWTPVQIELVSTKKYDNPYSDVELTATFTHSDGTVITIPGFWYEGNTFAARFSPTKAGVWNYSITADDGNESLSKKGVINATASTSDNPLKQHGHVKVEENNSFFVHDDGTPFIWMGDTHWQAPNYERWNSCNYPRCTCGNQVKHIINNRKEKGFTVYQTYFDTAESDGGGNKGLVDSIWAQSKVLPSSEIFNDKVDGMFEYVYENGMVLALGFGVHTSTANRMPLEDMKNFVRYVVGRYSCYSIMWITAQEITRTSESIEPDLNVMQYWIEVAKYVASIDGYNHPASAHLDAIDFTDPRIIALSTEDWLTYWASQGGHSYPWLPKKQRYQRYRTTNKPVVEAEYNYEDINCAGFANYDLTRFGAWISFMNGCGGYTYGVTGIWAQNYSNELPGWYGEFTSYNYEPWFIGLDKPGSYDMMYLVNFFKAIEDFDELKARYTDMTYGAFLADENKSLLSKDDKSVFVGYFRNEDTSTGTLIGLDPALTYKVLWYNPITGKYIEVQEGLTGVDSYEIPHKPTILDWTLLITADDFSGYSVEAPYTRPEKSENIGSIVTPYRVDAMGGVYYVNNRISDNTKFLYDLDGKYSWEPLADRTTKTIIYDLGIPYNVTQINIVPATKTILPAYRIEGSNDKKDWTVIVHTDLHEQTLSADGTYISEPLTGAYRYIKVLILNTHDIPKDQVGKVDYLTVNNSKSIEKAGASGVYSKLAIAEISVFASGAAESIQVTVPEKQEPQVIVEETTKLDTVPVAVVAAVAVVAIVAVIVIPFKKKEQ